MTLNGAFINLQLKCRLFFGVHEPQRYLRSITFAELYTAPINDAKRCTLGMIIRLASSIYQSNKSCGACDCEELEIKNLLSKSTPSNFSAMRSSWYASPRYGIVAPETNSLEGKTRSYFCECLVFSNSQN